MGKRTGLLIPGQRAYPPGTVGVPFYKFLTAEFHDEINRLQMPEGSHLLYRPGFEPADQRNWLAENFEGDWLLQVDSDQAFAGESLNRLLYDVYELGADIVSGVYYQRGGDFRPGIFQATGGKDASGKWAYHCMHEPLVEYLKAHKDEVQNVPYQVFQDPHLLECDAVPTGFLLVRRSVFDRVGKPWFSFSERGTEDLWFCRRAKECGYKVYADLSVQVGHFAMLPVGHLHYLAHYGIIK